MTALTSESQYLPSIGWLCLARKSRKVMLDAAEHYQKGSLRNKAILRIAGKPTVLTVPLTKGKHSGVPTSEVAIHAGSDWWRQHQRSIKMAFGKAPYFVHFIDEMSTIYTRARGDLWSLNLDIIHWMNDTLGLELEIGMQMDFIRPEEDDACMRDMMRYKGERTIWERRIQCGINKVLSQTHIPYEPDVRESGVALMYHLGRETRLVLDRINSVADKIS